MSCGNRCVDTARLSGCQVVGAPVSALSFSRCQKFTKFSSWDYDHLGPSSACPTETELDHALSQTPLTKDKQLYVCVYIYIYTQYTIQYIMIFNMNFMDFSKVPNIRWSHLPASPPMDEPPARRRSAQTGQIFAGRWRRFEDRHHRGWRNQSAARQKCPGCLDAMDAL